MWHWSIVAVLLVAVAFPAASQQVHAPTAGMTGVGCGEIRKRNRADPTNVANAIAAAFCDQPANAAGNAFQDAMEIVTAFVQSGCTRHLYNKSGFTWALIPNDTLLRRHMCGFGTDADDTLTAKARIESICTATPGRDIEIRFPAPEGGDDKQQIEILGYRGTLPGGGGDVETLIFDQTFDIKAKAFGQCWTISHSGNTGDVVVNDPADGDIATCGFQSYKCSTTVPEPTLAELSEAAHQACLANVNNPNCHWVCIDGTVVTDTAQCSTHGGYGFRSDRLHGTSKW
jgi:hypothetical protein